MSSSNDLDHINTDIALGSCLEPGTAIAPKIIRALQ